jgi:hypothetical protein
MSTNYYHRHEDKPSCKCCGRPYENEPDHIGKSSVGWAFSWSGLKHRSVEEWAISLKNGVRHDTDEFLEWARAEPGRRHFDHMTRHYPEEVKRGEVWLDIDGHSFLKREFS